MDKRKINEWKWKKEESQLRLFKIGCWGIYSIWMQEWWSCSGLEEMAQWGHSGSVLLANVILIIISTEHDVLACGKCGVGEYCGLWWGNLRERTTW